VERYAWESAARVMDEAYRKIATAREEEI